MAANRMLWIVGRLALLDEIVEERWAKLANVEAPDLTKDIPQKHKQFFFNPEFTCKVCDRPFLSKGGLLKHQWWLRDKLDGHAVGADFGAGAAPVLPRDLDNVGPGGVLGVGGEGGGLVGGPDDPPADRFLR